MISILPGGASLVGPSQLLTLATGLIGYRVQSAGAEDDYSDDATTLAWGGQGLAEEHSEECAKQEEQEATEVVKEEEEQAATEVLTEEEWKAPIEAKAEEEDAPTEAWRRPCGRPSGTPCALQHHCRRAHNG